MNIKDKRLLVLGGSGGTGTFAIQIAKLLGAKFVATTSSNEELCKQLGADLVINHREQQWYDKDVLRSLGDLDMIYDTVSSSAQSRCLPLKGV